MSSDTLAGSPRALLAVGTAVYASPDFEDLDGVPASLKTIVDTLTKLGYATVSGPPGYSVDLGLSDLRASLRKAIRAAPTVVVYYTGHAAQRNDTLYLVSQKSRYRDLARTATRAIDLLEDLRPRDGDYEVVTERPKVLIILDCIYPESRAIELLSQAPAFMDSDTWVLTSSGSPREVQHGGFVAAFAQAIEQSARAAHPQQQFLGLESIVANINDSGHTNARLFPPPHGSLGIPPFFPNPSYNPYPFVGRVGRVLVGDEDHGGGFALGPRLVVTADHVLRGREDRPVTYIPTWGNAVGVERVQSDVGHDVAILWLTSDVGAFLPTSGAEPGARWQSPPAHAADPVLTGTVSVPRMTIQSSGGQPLEVMQLQVDQQLGDYAGYGGNAVLDSPGQTVLGLLVEQYPLRTTGLLGESWTASNVMYAVPIADVITTFGLPVPTSTPTDLAAGETVVGLAADIVGDRTQVLAGGISADLVNPDRGIPREDDDLGVSTYVAMMATAIARKDTKLPLSIGLFGEWGSGKSYFMGLLRNQVAGLASSGDPAYNSGIVQIGFNAWSYADANLWASLGDEIFRQLAGPTDEKEGAEARERRERIRKWLADEQGRVKELEAAKAAATIEVAKLRGELERREHDRANSALTLLRATVRAVEADPQTRAELRSAWDKLGLKDETEQARLLADAVTGTRDDMTAIRRAAARGNRRYLVTAVLAAGLVLVIAGLDSWGVLGQLVSRVLTGTGLATLLVAGVTFATLTKRVADGVRSVTDLANAIRQRTQAGRNEQVKAALEQVRAAEAREQVLQAQLEQVVARVGELGRDLVDLSPGQRLYAFIAERAASDDYRHRLGLIATIRRDFERLARLQVQWRNDKEGRSPKPIDRIVLYIDDLDRCTPRQVVEVLQAVHLLLALDLFVVVVGVDPRWLLHSLRDQYRNTLSSPLPWAETATAVEATAAEAPRGGNEGAMREDADRLLLSTPRDYLEKIFNVPFVLPVMTAHGFDTMIRRLSITEGDTHDLDQQAVDDDPLARDPFQVETPSPPPEVNPTDRTGIYVPPRVEEGSEIAAVRHGETVNATPLTEPELSALSSLAPLVRSPREAKRLLNLYRMLRSTRDLSDASRFLGGEGAEGEFQAVAILLGLLTASPQLLGQILFAVPDPENQLMGGICHRADANSWDMFLNGLRPRCVDGRWHNDVCDGLSKEARADWELLVDRARPASALVKLTDLTTFKAWAPHVARFSFLLTPATNSDRTAASPGTSNDELRSEPRLA